MSAIDKKVKKAIERALTTRHNKEEFRRVQDFVADARERGLIVQRKYDIPLVDTIGPTTFRDTKAR